MRSVFAEALRCLHCGDRLTLEARGGADADISEGALTAACGLVAPIIGGVPRLLPPGVTGTLLSQYPEFFRRHPDLRPAARDAVRLESLRTLQAFGDDGSVSPNC